MYSPPMVGWMPYTTMMKASSIEHRLTEALPKDSKDWLIAALDPFHDYQFDCEGLPDERTAPSVVQIHNTQYTLTAPGSALGGNWDASVLFTGFNSSNVLESVAGGMITETSSSVHGYSSSSAAQGHPFGTLNIWAGGAGATMSTGAPALVSNETYEVLNGIQNPDRCRVIGAAFEITNTTSELYKQGSLTVAQLPDSADDPLNIRYYDSASPTTSNFVQADRGPIQACTLKPLLAVPGSSSWPAAQGVYVVPRLTQIPKTTAVYGQVSSTVGVSSRVPILYGTDGKTATPEPYSTYSETFAGAVQKVPQFLPYAPNYFTPIQVFLSGLSNQTTLVIKLRLIVEYFPSLTSSLLPLASPSPAYDPKVFALYSAIASEAPYAVPVDQNAAGDYFRKIMKVAGTGLQWLSPIFGTAGPAASMIGYALEKGSSLIPRDEAGPRAMQQPRRITAAEVEKRKREMARTKRK